MKPFSVSVIMPHQPFHPALQYNSTYVVKDEITHNFRQTGTMSRLLKNPLKLALVQLACGKLVAFACI